MCVSRWNGTLRKDIADSFPCHARWRSLSSDGSRAETSAVVLLGSSKANSSSSKICALESTVAINWRARLSSKVNAIVRHRYISFENKSNILDACAWYFGVSRRSTGAVRDSESGSPRERVSQSSINAGCGVKGPVPDNEHQRSGRDKAIFLQ